MDAPAAKLRLDKWLWFARFFKTRSLAARMISDGQVRVNATKAAKPSQTVSPGDVLTFAQGKQVRVVRITALGARRGPAQEAQTLYDDLTPEPDATPRTGGGARPTKRDRRAIDQLRQD